MKCIVTGAAGFIGSSMVSRLIREGYEVKAKARNYNYPLLESAYSPTLLVKIEAIKPPNTALTRLATAWAFSSWFASTS